MPLQKTFETSFGVVDQRPLLVFHVYTEDGCIGYGESSPLYIPISEKEILQDGLAMLQNLLPRYLGVSFDAVDETIPLFHSISGFPVTKIGLEGALHHLVAQKKNMPLFRYFGSTRGKVLVGESIGIASSIDIVLNEIADAVKDGYKRVKIKIKPGRDVEVVQAVRRHFPFLPLAVDANAAYSENDIEYLSQLAVYDLLYIEQPFAASNFFSNKKLKDKSGTKICLDESIRNVATCLYAIENNCCDIVNIKPARIGSFIEAIRIHDICIQNGIALFGGGRLESGIGRLTNAALYSLPGFTLPSDLTSPLVHFGTDVVHPPFTVVNGTVTLSDTSILGASINEEIIGKYTKELLTFE